MSSPVKFVFSHLSKWREYAEAIRLAVKELDESAEVYVIGSIASGKYTVRSDIDILIVIKKDLKGREKRTFKVKVLELAFDKLTCRSALQQSFMW
ncbi:nucleotidyltransferase domain-containing protein [Candidatus Acidianus copahuensis]|uniref:nucleotidyltransferase domain-containing protein n=1 Tax=Candidatus Acidianus copahuensis TaxID=1160895 RepID=UPI000693FEA5|nr:nucleotidyltransferase domain-containing protein [Candidatus Acidianus copahuensis]